MSTATVATQWAIDPTHSEISFKVKHLVISTVTGFFREFSGGIEQAGEGFEGAEAYFSANINSIDTNQSDRDNHLKSDDFFNAAAYPEMTFRSTAFEKAGENKFKVTGDLTIRDVTKTVVLHADFLGEAADPYGNHKAGFEINGSINRKEFGLKWNAVTEAGAIVVSDEVRLHLNVQVVKQ
ncbi:MAG TPA: YceI family protein [Saprospiraceae bacterium]|nr:YceI family protein [Saprospiraceae bacterium]HMP23607.1 YceI family protein [Saprospiraceae bacterium]